MFVYQLGLTSTHSLTACEPAVFGIALWVGSLAYWKRWRTFQVILIRSLPFHLHWTKSQSRHPSKTLLKELKRRYILNFLQAISQSRTNNLAALLDSLGINPQSPPRALTQLVTHMMHPSRLRDLRKFLNDESVSFKNPQQALALELIRGKEPSLLVIGPTGTTFLHCISIHFAN